jgi:A/G-specific adenine glycosylase
MGKNVDSIKSTRQGNGERPSASPNRRSFERSLLALSKWFERNRRVLPWRDDPATYRVWISEIMLQQTQVVTVVPYFEKFVARFPTVESLASASEEDVMLHWAGLGYYSRARNLRKGAQAIVAKGRFPQTREEWLEIPGVGDYTAGAILSIALDLPEAILDGNVERVLSRVRRVARGRGDAAYKARLWRLSRVFVERGAAVGVRPRVLNQALMELGATTCTPRKPLCAFCPLTEICRARVEGEQETYPPRKAPKEWLQVREELHCVLDERGDRVLVRRREAGEWRAGLWDLPALTAADRAAAAPGGAKLELLGSLETKHVVTRHKVTRVTKVWRVVKTRGRAKAAVVKIPGVKERGLLMAAEGARLGVGSGDAGYEVGSSVQEGLRWISVDQPEVAVGSALRRTLQQVRERYGA